MQLLYSYCFICTDHFKKSVDQKKIPGLSNVSKDGFYWRCMQRLGMYIKVFQFGVCIYDLLVLDRENIFNNLNGGMLSTPEKTAQLAFGLLLLFIGQVLNYAVFEALGAKGVYYGYEFGYPVARVYCFPYNLNISDPQYWGAYYISSDLITIFLQLRSCNQFNIFNDRCGLVSVRHLLRCGIKLIHGSNFRAILVSHVNEGFRK